MYSGRATPNVRTQNKVVQPPLAAPDGPGAAPGVGGPGVGGPGVGGPGPGPVLQPPEQAAHVSNV